MVNYMAPRKRIGLSFKSQNLLKLVFISVHCLFLFVVTFLLYFSIASPFCWLGKWLEPSPPLSWAFSRFRFFFCTEKYKPLLKQMLRRKAQQIWNFKETMWNLQSYYLQFPWSAHSCPWPTSPGTSATGEPSSAQIWNQLSSSIRLAKEKFRENRCGENSFQDNSSENSFQEKKGVKRIVTKGN